MESCACAAQPCRSARAAHLSHGRVSTSSLHTSHFFPAGRAGVAAAAAQLLLPLANSAIASLALQAARLASHSQRRLDIRAAAAQQQADGEAALGRAALLRNAALLTACSAAAALLPWPSALAAAAEPAAASVLPPLAPLRYSAAGPHSRLELAEPQRLPLPPGPIPFPRPPAGSWS